MVGKTPDHCRRSNRTVSTQQDAITKRFHRSVHTVNTQHNALSRTTTKCCRRSDHAVNIQQNAPSGTVVAYNLRSRSDHTANTQQHTLSGTVTMGCRKSDHTVNTQHHALSGPNTSKLRYRTDHNVKSQQQTIPGPLSLLGKTPKLHGASDHTVKVQPQTLFGSLVMLGKTPKLQVELPLDLVVYQILTRLPVKSLSRFRCVSKPLRSFINDPHFQKVHARRSQQTPVFLVAKGDTRGVHFSTFTIHGEQLLKRFSLIYARPQRHHRECRFELVHSCLGLVCLRNSDDGTLRIFNPSTAELITLPECPDQYFDINVCFGYTDISDEFKVVRFFTGCLRDNIADEDCFSEVFTLGSSHGWRETRSPPPFIPCGTGHLPLVHGAFHFMPEIQYYEHVRDDHYISAFDLSTEQYRGNPLPELYFDFDDTDHVIQCQLTELRGSLCMSFDFFKSKKLLQLWFLKDYFGGKWVKQYNIHLSYPPAPDVTFAVHGDGSVLLCTEFSRIKQKLMYYNAQKNGAIKMLGINFSAMLYVDSFLPLPRSGKWVSNKDCFQDCLQYDT